MSPRVTARALPACDKSNPLPLETARLTMDALSKVLHEYTRPATRRREVYRLVSLFAKDVRAALVVLPQSPEKARLIAEYNRKMAPFQDIAFDSIPQYTKALDLYSPRCP